MGNNFPKVAKITDFGPGRPDERERMIEVGKQRTEDRGQGKEGEKLGS